jgi:hypothetical protein
MDWLKAMKKEILAVAIAFLMALGVIFLVKKYLAVLGAANSDKDVILYLEFGAILLVFTSFILSEFLRVFRHIVYLMRNVRVTASSNTGYITLFLTVFVSLCIYFSFVRLAIAPW